MTDKEIEAVLEDMREEMLASLKQAMGRVIEHLGRAPTKAEAQLIADAVADAWRGGKTDHRIEDYEAANG